MEDTVPVWVVMVCFAVIGALYAASHVTIHKRISENKRDIGKVSEDCADAAFREAALSRHNEERIQDDVNAKHHRIRREYTELHAHVLQIAYTIDHLSKKESTNLIEALSELRKMTEIRRAGSSEET